MPINLSVLAQHIAERALDAQKEPNSTLGIDQFESTVMLLLEAKDNSFWRDIIINRVLAQLPEIVDEYVKDQQSTLLGNKVFNTLNNIKRLT